jgi:WD40 repeat protein
MVASVALSPDGNLLAAGTFGLISRNTLKVWDLRTGRALRLPLHRVQYVGNLVFSPNGDKLAVGDDDGLSIVDIPRHRRDWLVREHNTYIGATFSPDGELLATTHPDGTIRLWDVRTLKTRATLTAPAGPAGIVVFSPEGNTLAARCADATVRVWDVASGTELRSLVLHQKWSPSLAYLADGKTLAWASLDGTLGEWNVNTGKEIGVFPLTTPSE